MKTTTALLVTTVLLLSGCGPTKFCKPGASSSDFNRDKYECQHRARQMAQFGGVYDPFEDLSQLRECLNYKGWYPCSNQ